MLFIPSTTKPATTNITNNNNNFPISGKMLAVIRKKKGEKRKSLLRNKKLRKLFRENFVAVTAMEKRRGKATKFPFAVARKKAAEFFHQTEMEEEEEEVALRKTTTTTTNSSKQQHSFSHPKQQPKKPNGIFPFMPFFFYALMRGRKFSFLMLRCCLFLDGVMMAVFFSTCFLFLSVVVAVAAFLILLSFLCVYFPGFNPCKENSERKTLAPFS